MMVIRPKIAAISYLNTVPFIYGIRQDADLSEGLQICIPSECYRKYVGKEVDIALLPAAMVPTLQSTEIITEYCIGAVGKVRTVVISSNCAMERIRRIWVDAHSRTAVQMAGYLASAVWHVSPEWLSMEDYSVMENPAEGDAFLLIGDKVFATEGKFAYSYDLAEEWVKATRLPFAFAVWVARKGMSYEVYDRLQHALTFGLEHVYEAIRQSEYADCDYAYDYLTRNIDFLFDDEKHKALKKLWDYGLKVAPKVSPG